MLLCYYHCWRTLGTTNSIQPILAWCRQRLRQHSAPGTLVCNSKRRLTTADSTVDCFPLRVFTAPFSSTSITTHMARTKQVARPNPTCHPTKPVSRMSTMVAPQPNPGKEGAWMPNRPLQIIHHHHIGRCKTCHNFVLHYSLSMGCNKSLSAA